MAATTGVSLVLGSSVGACDVDVSAPEVSGTSLSELQPHTSAKTATTETATLTVLDADIADNSPAYFSGPRATSYIDSPRGLSRSTAALRRCCSGNDRSQSTSLPWSGMA